MSAHAGPTLAVPWSSVYEHSPATCSVDGAVRTWGVRKSNGLVSLLDKEVITGLAYNETATRVDRPSPLLASVHTGAVDGIT